MSEALSEELVLRSSKPINSQSFLRFAFTRIVGLGHVRWIPLLGWLAFRLGQIPADDAFGLWIRGVMLLNAVSLVIDIADVVRYAAGDRKELVAGL